MNKGQLKKVFVSGYLPTLMIGLEQIGLEQVGLEQVAGGGFQKC
jgi:hypothetical protein